MNTIKKIITEYEKLLHKNYKYTLSNGMVIELYFAKEYLPHLLGLQYLDDVPMLNRYKNQKGQALKTYNALKRGVITDEQIQNSKHFDDIKDRFENIIDMETVCFKNIIFKYDKKLAGTNIEADMLLLNFNKKLKLHLFIKQDERLKKYIPVTFFDNTSSKYYENQEILEVSNIEVIEYLKKDKH